MTGHSATHFTLIGFTVFGGLAAVSYWFPKMTGARVDEDRARISFMVMFGGTLLALLPLIVIGVNGGVSDASRFPMDRDLGLFHMFATVGMCVFFVGLVLALANLIRSRQTIPDPSSDPWRGDSLEWLVGSPAPGHNFDVLPDVRSDRPMRDVRAAVSHRDSGQAARESQPVA